MVAKLETAVRSIVDAETQRCVISMVGHVAKLKQNAVTGPLTGAQLFRYAQGMDAVVNGVMAHVIDGKPLDELDVQIEWFATPSVNHPSLITNAFVNRHEKKERREYGAGTMASTTLEVTPSLFPGLYVRNTHRMAHSTGYSLVGEKKKWV